MQLDLVIKGLWAVARPWKPASLRMVFLETTVPDAFWNSRSICDIGLVRFFQISFNNTRQSLSASFLSLPGRSTFRYLPLIFHFLITKATVDLGMFNSLDISFKDRPFLWYPTISPFWKSHSSEFRGIFNAINADTSSYTIFKYKKLDVNQDRRYHHLHRCPKTYW